MNVTIKRADDVADFASHLGDLDRIFFESSAKRDFRSEEETRSRPRRHSRLHEGLIHFGVLACQLGMVIASLKFFRCARSYSETSAEHSYGVNR